MVKIRRWITSVVSVYLLFTICCIDGFAAPENTRIEGVRYRQIEAPTLYRIYSLTESHPAGGYDFTGFGYQTVSEEVFFCYNELTEVQRSIYTKLKHALFNMKEGRIPLGDCTAFDISLAFKAVKDDFPEMFWVPSKYRIVVYKGTNCIFFKLGGTNYYPYDPSTRDAMLEEVYGKVEEALSTVITPDMSQFDREVALHDWLLQGLEYDYAAVEDGSVNPYHSDVYGALVQGKSMCMGYAKGFQLLLRAAGVNSTTVTGRRVNEESEEIWHMWNAVEIDGTWYHTDPTFDDMDGGIEHFFFNMDTATLQITHELPPDYTASDLDAATSYDIFNVAVPACDSLEQNYFVKIGNYIETADSFYDKVTEGVAATLEKGGSKAEFMIKLDLLQDFSDSQAVLGSISDHSCIESANEKVPADLEYDGGMVQLRGLGGLPYFTLELQ